MELCTLIPTAKGKELLLLLPCEIPKSKPKKPRKRSLLPRIKPERLSVTHKEAFFWFLNACHIHIYIARLIIDWPLLDAMIQIVKCSKGDDKAKPVRFFMAEHPQRNKIFKLS